LGEYHRPTIKPRNRAENLRSLQRRVDTRAAILQPDFSGEHQEPK
jgi:hypothetical protein